jgi:hypothetical protein
MTFLLLPNRSSFARGIGFVSMLLLASTLTTAPAAADSTLTFGYPPDPHDLPPDSPTPPGKLPRTHSFEGYPLSLVMSRLSFGFEQMLVDHHALLIGAHGQAVAYDGGALTDFMVAFGGDAGYRFYSGRNGPRGFFFGPSIMLDEVYSGGTLNLGFLAGSKRSWMTATAVAMDVGWQSISKKGLLFGIGAGAQYTFTGRDHSEVGDAAWLLMGRGVRPRVLLAIGKAF